MDYNDLLSDNEFTSMLKPEEVARLLHVHVNTIRRWSDSGIIRAYRFGTRGDRRFRREDIDQFLARYSDNEVVIIKKIPN